MQERHRSLSYTADRPSKMLILQQLIRADDNIRSTTQKQQTFNNLSDKISLLVYYLATY